MQPGLSSNTTSVIEEFEAAVDREQYMGRPTVIEHTSVNLRRARCLSKDNEVEDLYSEAMGRLASIRY